MVGYLVIGILAAFGVLAMLWAIFGSMLPDCRGCALVCWDVPDEGIVSRYWWLTGVGLLRCPLIAVVSAETPVLEPAERCTGEALLARLEWERRKSDGTGIGDHSGRHQRRGISEL